MPKKQQGGPLINEAAYILPIYGSYLSIKDAINEPSLSNIFDAGLSVAGDVGLILGAGALPKAALALRKARTAEMLSKGVIGKAAFSKAARIGTDKAAKSLLILPKLDLYDDLGQFVVKTVPRDESQPNIQKKY